MALGQKASTATQTAIVDCIVNAAMTYPSGGRPSALRNGVLLAGAVLNGSFAALAMWLAGRVLGLVAFEALAQLWTLWGLVAVGVVFAFQQWEVARNVGVDCAQRLRLPASVLLALIAASVLALAMTGIFRARLFGSESWAWPLAAASLPVGTAITGIGYATFARAGRLRDLAAVMAGENGARMVVTAVLASLNASPVAFALTVPIGFLVSLIPLATTPTTCAHSGPSMASSAGQLPALAMVGSATHFLVFGGPLLLGAAGGQAATVSTLFLVLILPRVPLLLVSALVPAVVVQGAVAVTRGDAPQVARWVVLLSGMGVGLAVLGGAFAYLLADSVAEVVFQAGGQLEPVAYGLLGSAVGLVLATSLTNPLLIAMGRLRAVATCWGVVILSGALLTGFGVISDPRALTSWMSLCAAGILVAHLAFALSASSDAAG